MQVIDNELIGSIAVDDKGKLNYPVPEVNVLEINLSQLSRNYAIIKAKLKPGTKLLAVLKGNAYGHGIIAAAQELERIGCDAIGVVRLNEAYALRLAGIKTPILLMAPTLPSQASVLIQYNITPMVEDKEMLDALEREGICRHKAIEVHLKINTGLNRYGIEPEAAVDFIKMLHREYSYVKLEGIYSHYQNPDYDPEFTKKQTARFLEVINRLESLGLKPPVVHMAGSAALLKYPETNYDMVRCGILLFGLEHTEGEKEFPEGVRPMMTLKSHILRIRWIKAGEHGGYGEQFVAKKNTRVAIIGLGYGDGISRGWKEILIAGRRVPIVNYFMDAVMADITEIDEEIKEFDEAVFIGRQGTEEIGWGEVCEVQGTYEDEQVQYITERVPKNYIYD